MAKAGKSGVGATSATSYFAETYTLSLPQPTLTCTFMTLIGDSAMHVSQTNLDGIRASGGFSNATRFSSISLM